MEKRIGSLIHSIAQTSQFSLIGSTGLILKFSENSETAQCMS